MSEGSDVFRVLLERYEQIHTKRHPEGDDMCSDCDLIDAATAALEAAPPRAPVAAGEAMKTIIRNEAVAVVDRACASGIIREEAIVTKLILDIDATVARLVADAVAGEREACAKIAEKTNDCCECLDDECCKGPFCRTAQAIRARARTGGDRT